MVVNFESYPNTYKLSELIEWQRNGQLILNPEFQRRSVWKRGAKSYLVDTVSRNLPVPLIFLRDVLDVEAQRSVKYVIDGQQRLRTLFAFVDPNLLTDFNPDTDAFKIARNHNPDLANKTFVQLPKNVQRTILSYRFSTQVLGSEVEDRDVLEVFARLNSTGMRLNYQEQRNAEWFGSFKTSMYQLAYEQLERWIIWGIFSESEISRMDEVELVSDLVNNILNGSSGRTKGVLDKIYEQYDEEFPYQSDVEARFRHVMDEIETMLGDVIAKSFFSRESLFFTLFQTIYNEIYDLSFFEPDSRPVHLSGARRREVRERLLQAAEDFKHQRVPADVWDSFAKSSTHPGRREIRLNYLKSRIA